MKRSMSENDMTYTIHRNIDIYRAITENIREINGIVNEIKYIDKIVDNISENETIKTDSEFISMVIERDLYYELLDCIKTHLEFNLSNLK